MGRMWETPCTARISNVLLTKFVMLLRDMTCIYKFFSTEGSAFQEQSGKQLEIDRFMFSFLLKKYIYTKP